ncbi:MAG TPA: adenylate/guanylate cyclase domain-containing protein [Candidatus Limnocylindrales bacterium]|nr:adenylate/guanylate cyclase domain-containing protein [Candidatus Limnocylindrales bacterium]
MRCRACGATTRPAARFCDQCGSQLDHARTATKPVPDPAAERGDRRIVTALFADLVDYVRLVAEHDAEDVRRRVDAALTAMVGAIEAHDGTREKFIGDAIFAVFGWPQGHDDDALRATHCALAIREALAQVDAAAGGEPLQVRIGIATGEVVAAPRSGDGPVDWSLTGPAVTTAARIQGIARPGEILLDEQTIRAARKGLEVEDRGLQLLRGQTHPIRVARLLGQAGFQPWLPPTGRLIGREREHARLRELLAALARLQGGAVVVEGDAGIGKSRLMADLAADTRSAGLAWTWVDNVSYGAHEPYRFGRALAQLLADEQGTDSGSLTRRLLFTADVPADQARVWAGAVAAIARDAAFSGWEEEAPLVPADPAAVAAAIRELTKRYIRRLIEMYGPRVIVIDDLHWLDPSSAGMIDETIRLTSELPLLLLVGTRPGTSPAAAAIEDLERIRLDGLDEGETRELAGAIAGSDILPGDARRLHERTAGNPLYIAETVRAILEEPGSPAGRLALDGQSSRKGMPATLRALLGARIDALAEDARTLIRVASVIGMTFREATVEAILGTSPDPADYQRLAESSLIVPLEAAAGWRFSHPLIHDAAYWGLLGTSRRRLHARVADQLEASAGRGAIGAVARHRAAAGDVERAVPLLAAAAEEALAVGASAEAASFLTSAADLLANDPEAESFRQRARAALDLIPTAGTVAGS